MGVSEVRWPGQAVGQEESQEEVAERFIRDVLHIPMNAVSLVSRTPEQCEFDSSSTYKGLLTVYRKVIFKYRLCSEDTSIPLVLELKKADNRPPCSLRSSKSQSAKTPSPS